MSKYRPIKHATTIEKRCKQMLKCLCMCKHTHNYLHVRCVCVCVQVFNWSCSTPTTRTITILTMHTWHWVRGSCISSIISTELARQLVPTTTLQLNQQYPPTHWEKPCNVRTSFNWPFLCTSAAAAAAGLQLMRTTASTNIPKPTRWVPHWLPTSSSSLIHLEILYPLICNLPLFISARVPVWGRVCGRRVWGLSSSLDVDVLSYSGKTYNWLPAQLIRAFIRINKLFKLCASWISILGILIKPFSI